MKKNTSLALAVLIFIIILSAGIWLLASRFSGAPDGQEATPITSNIILFYGEECPHCKDLERFLEENKIAEKVNFDSVEIWHNQKNQALLLSKAAECGFKEDEIGVPFLYSEGKCLIGPSQIESFFKVQAGME